MDIPTPSSSGKMDTPYSGPVSSHTLPPSGNGELDYDQTIKIKSPGSGMMAFNRYMLDRVLGRGGMGVVWLAEDTKLERPVALKFLPSLIGLDPAAVKELKTETRRGLELSHPHIVRIYDFVDDEDAAAISMEFVDGKTLSELRLTTETGVFSVDEVSKWLLGVCDALDYAHFQRKLIHRDLKPANIMLTSKDEIAKIADFGIARSLSDTMSRLSAAHIGTSGTLPYMSPQQAMGERPQPTDDVYSLGATIYELLSGKPPFYRGDLPTQINSKIPPSVYERRQELEILAKEAVPKHWEEAIAACLHKEPSLRPSCAGALAEMLGLKPLTVSARTGTYATVAARSAAQASTGNKTPLIAAAAALAIGAGAAVYYFTQKPEPTLQGTSPAVSAASPKPPVPVTLVDESIPASPTGVTVGGLAPIPDPAPAPVPPPAAPTATVPTMATAPVPTAPPPSPSATPAPAPTGVGTPTPLGGLSLTPDATGATSGALANIAPPAATPPMPPGIETPVGGFVLTQPVVTAPESGFWTLQEMFPVLPHSTYSEKGKRYLLYKTQSELKEKGLYNASVDGAEGKNTHNAIVLFQVKSGLEPTGMLDIPTLAALEFSAEPDNSDWSSSSSSGSSSSRKRSKPKEESGFFKKTGDSIKKLFK